jgi:NADH-quinone oxidoreductase subunit N
MIWLAIIGVISSIIASYFYLRIIVLMYFKEPAHDEPGIPVKENNISYMVIGLASAALVALGLMPGILTNAAGYFFK